MKKAKMVLVLMMALVMVLSIFAPAAVLASHGQYNDMCTFDGEPSRFAVPCDCTEYNMPGVPGRYANCKDMSGKQHGCSWHSGLATVTGPDGQVKPVWKCASKGINVSPSIQTAKPVDWDPAWGRADWAITLPSSNQSFWLYIRYGKWPSGPIYTSYFDEFIASESRVFHYAAINPFGSGAPFNEKDRYIMIAELRSGLYGPVVNTVTTEVRPPSEVEFSLE